MIKVNIRPLSVNDAWKGRRSKTPEYKRYENSVGFLLPKIKLPAPPYKICFEFGFSNPQSDYDNPVKPLQDILQKKYGFNDKDIYQAEIKKVLVPKGQEYIAFEITSL